MARAVFCQRCNAGIGCPSELEAVVFEDYRAEIRHRSCGGKLEFRLVETPPPSPQGDPAHQESA